MSNQNIKLLDRKVHSISIQLILIITGGLLKKVLLMLYLNIY